MGKGFEVHIDPSAIMQRFEKSARELGKAINAFVYTSAVKDYVPEDTRALAKSIREKVIIENGQLICRFSSALHYAKRQHDFTLHHAGTPKGYSFASYGTVSMNERTTPARDIHRAKYESGYERMKDSFEPYASRFFEKPLDFVRDNLDRFASVFYSSFNRGNR